MTPDAGPRAETAGTPPLPSSCPIPALEESEATWTTGDPSMSIMSRERAARQRTEAAARRIRPLTAYYNGACPICRAEIDEFRKAVAGTEAERSHAWCDVSKMPMALSARGVEPDEVVRRLHVVDEEGRLWRGLDAFLALWRSIPRYRWLARVLALPGVRGVAEWTYERIVAPWHYRRGRHRRGGPAAAH